MGQFWTKLVVIVHKIARFRTRKPNSTLSALKSIHRKNNPKIRKQSQWQSQLQ